MKRSRHGLNLDDFSKHAEQLNRLSDPELILLKAHMLAERVLVQVLAARLREPDVENVPRLSFDRLIDLSIQDRSERLPFVWFNDLRNALAHEFDALASADFKQIVLRFGVKWPVVTDGRREIIGALTDYVVLLAWQRYFNEMSEQLTLERAGKLPEEAKPYLERALTIMKLVDAVKSRLTELSEERAEGLSQPLPPSPQS